MCITSLRQDSQYGVNMAISAIEQIGVGVSDIDIAAEFFAHLGFRMSIFDSTSYATVMAPYTGGVPHLRRAKFVLNPYGGGGFELWQFLDRPPQQCDHIIEIGDLGINAVKLKCNNVELLHANLCHDFPHWHISPLSALPDNEPFFWLTDPFGNHFQIISGKLYKKKYFGKPQCGGVCGVIVGVNDMNKAVHFYTKALDFEVVWEEKDSTFKLPNSCEKRVHRIILNKKSGPVGLFSEFSGHMTIELVQNLDHISQSIFNNRYWGDLGFIHICFDVASMDAQKAHALKHGYTCSVDSQNSFNMGEAKGLFVYYEDPDRTLIELVEATEISICPSIGLSINLSKRKKKPLPRWFFSLLFLRSLF